MLVTYATVPLGTTALEGVAGLSVAGTQQNQPAPALRAQNAPTYARGNRSRQIGFSVSRSFSSLEDAEEFVHDHFDDLPASGDLVFTLADGSTSRTYAGAAIGSCAVSYRGLHVTIAYTFTATVAT